MKLPIFTTGIETNLLKDELLKKIEEVIDSGQFIMGPDVLEFEKEVAQYLGVKYAVGLNSGTDALVIGLKSAGIGEGDEVITTSFTFFATAEAVEQVGATPVFVDIDEETYNIDPYKIEEKITNKTKAIIPVHLYGHSANMGPIIDIAKKYNLKIIEDVAQAFGSKYNDKKVGAIGDVGCFSFFPTKNLGAYGDGGLLTTNDKEIYENAKMLRVHGAKKKYHNEIVGYNSRLDSIQAAILRVKLPRIDEWNEGRRRVAHKYIKELSDLENLILPLEKEYSYHVYHQFTIRVLGNQRDKLQEYLKSKGIGTMIYYPIPVHKLPLYNLDIDLPNTNHLTDEVLSLPIYPHMPNDHVEMVISTIKDFFNK